MTKKNEIWTSIGALWAPKKRGSNVVATGSIDVACSIILQPHTSIVIVPVDEPKNGGPQYRLKIVLPGDADTSTNDAQKKW